MAFDFQEELLQAPVPGESLTHPPGKFPFDGPPTVTQPEDALELVFSQIQKPKTTNRILDALSDEVPLEPMVGIILQALSGEGIIPVTLSPILFPSVTAMLEEIAEAAGVKVTRIADIAPAPEELIDISDLETLGNLPNIEEAPPAPEGGFLTTGEGA